MKVRSPVPFRTNQSAISWFTTKKIVLLALLTCGIATCVAFGIKCTSPKKSNEAGSGKKGSAEEEVAALAAGEHKANNALDCDINSTMVSNNQFAKKSKDQPPTGDDNVLVYWFANDHIVDNASDGDINLSIEKIYPDAQAIIDDINSIPFFNNEPYFAAAGVMNLSWSFYRVLKIMKFLYLSRSYFISANVSPIREFRLISCYIDSAIVSEFKSILDIHCDDGNARVKYDESTEILISITQCIIKEALVITPLILSEFYEGKKNYEDKNGVNMTFAPNTDKLNTIRQASSSFINQVTIDLNKYLTLDKKDDKATSICAQINMLVEAKLATPLALYKEYDAFTNLVMCALHLVIDLGISLTTDMSVQSA